MVEVFKTSVKQPLQATSVVELLTRHFPSTEITFDLDDCDNILRVKGDCFCPQAIINILTSKGITCGLLPEF